MIVNYEITNHEAYEAYPPAVVPTLLAHGAEFLVADYKSEMVENEASNVTVVVKFENKETAHAWYNSEEYQKIVHLRTDNTEGFIIFTDEFKMP